MTNFIATYQSRSVCTESPTLPAAYCTKHSDCQNKPFMSNANGRWTGQCIFLSQMNNTLNETKNITNKPTGLCEIQGKIINIFHFLFFFTSYQYVIV
jgi:hypothetical protein